MKGPFYFLVLVIAAFNSAQGAAFLGDYTNATNGVALTAGFVPDATRVMVGEPVFLTFVLSNRAERPFEFSHTRNEIFSVMATNAQGRAVGTRYYGMDANGFVKEEKVLPGKSFSARIFLNERCVFERPGDYTVTCRCDFRFFNKPAALPNEPITTVFKFTVGPSDAERVGEVIAKWRHVVEANGNLEEAATALAEIRDPRTIPALAELLTKAPGNYTAVDAIARFKDDAAADALVVVLKHGEDFAAGRAGEALRKSRQNDRVARGILPGLTDADAAVRIQAARAVSYTGSELAFGPLCVLLQDGSNSVRYAAAEAVGRLGDARSFGVLTNCLTNADFTLRIATVNGLRALGRPVRAEWVKPMIVGGGENIRWFYDAIDLLRMYGGDEAAPGLASCVHFDDPAVRHAYNMRLILALEFSPNGPKHYYRWHHDPNRDGTEKELAENRRILAELKAWLDRRGHQ